MILHITGNAVVDFILASVLFGFCLAAGMALFNGVLSLFGRRP